MCICCCNIGINTSNNKTCRQIISNIGIANDATSALAVSNVYALGIANFQNGTGGSPGTGAVRVRFDVRGRRGVALGNSSSSLIPFAFRS